MLKKNSFKSDARDLFFIICKNTSTFRQTTTEIKKYPATFRLFWCLVTDLLWKQKRKKVNLNNIFWSNAHYDIDIDLILSCCFIL